MVRVGSGDLVHGLDDVFACAVRFAIFMLAWRDEKKDERRRERIVLFVAFVLPLLLLRFRFSCFHSGWLGIDRLLVVQ